MIRRILLSTVLAMTVLAGLPLTAATVSANPPIYSKGDWQHRRGHVHYEVLYRHRGHWDSYGTFHNRHDAERAADHLRRRGHVVRIEREYVRGR